MVEGIHFTTEVCDDWRAIFQKISSSNDQDHKYHQQSKRILDATTASQLQSKLWMINELLNIYMPKDGLRTIGPLRPKNIVFLGGWYAQFSVELLMTHLKPDFIQNYEIDRDVKNISNRLINVRNNRNCQ